MCDSCTVKGEEQFQSKLENVSTKYILVTFCPKSSSIIKTHLCTVLMALNASSILPVLKL
jgi:hypothetical protein